jgi:cytoskeletal protein RodZ
MCTTVLMSVTINGMNKNSILSVGIVVLLALGLWWFVARTTPQDALTPTRLPASPTVTVTKTPTQAITISSPKQSEVVASPIIVTGQARVFENQFTVQAKDSTGKIIATAHVFTDATDAGLYGNYRASLSIPVGTIGNIKIEALSYSAKGDGSFEGYASVTVKLKTQ